MPSQQVTRKRSSSAVPFLGSSRRKDKIRFLSSSRLACKLKVNDKFSGKVIEVPMPLSLVCGTNDQANIIHD